MKRFFKYAAVFLIGVAAILTIPTSVRASQSAVLNDAEEYNGHYYRIFDYGMTWKKAKEFYESMGGHLVTITSSEEQEFVDELLLSGTKNSYWTGGYKTSKETWKWVTAEDFSQYTN